MQLYNLILLPEHLDFLSDGRITSKTLRGRTTIEIFNLNREKLLGTRLNIIKEFQNSFMKKVYNIQDNFKERTPNLESIIEVTFKDFISAFFVSYFLSS